MLLLPLEGLAALPLPPDSDCNCPGGDARQLFPSLHGNLGTRGLWLIFPPAHSALCSCAPLQDAVSPGHGSASAFSSPHWLWQWFCVTIPHMGKAFSNKLVSPPKFPTPLSPLSSNAPGRFVAYLSGTGPGSFLTP